MLYDDMKLFYEATNIPIYYFENQTLTLRKDSDLQNFNLPMLLFAGLMKPVDQVQQPLPLLKTQESAASQRKQNIAASSPDRLPQAWYSFTPEHLYFAGMQLPSQPDTPKDLCRTLFIGPLLLTECSLKQAENICQRIGRKRNQTLYIRQYFDAFPPRTVPGMLAALRLLHRLLGVKAPAEISPVEFQWQLPYPVTIQPSLSESDTDFGPDMEKQLLSCISSGNLSCLNRILNEQVMFIHTYPPLSVSEQRIYLLGANMLASRAAMKGGMDYQLANTMSGQYIPAIMKARTTDDLSYLFMEIFQDYTRRVADLNAQAGDSLLVRQIHQYIALHYDQKLSTAALAKHLKMNKSYLCTRFHKEAGMPLTDYINLQKIHEAKRLLSGSTLSAAQVSTTLGFSSQSYFGSVFKKVTGMTPESYREGMD